MNIASSFSAVAINHVVSLTFWMSVAERCTKPTTSFFIGLSLHMSPLTHQVCLWCRGEVMEALKL